MPLLDMPDHTIDLWWIPVPAVTVQAFYSCYGNSLSEDEQNRFASQRLRKGQLQFLLTRVALRQLLSAYHDDIHPGQWRMFKSATGRPCVDRAQSSLEFNLTHTDSLLLIALTREGEPGIDAEALGRSVDAQLVAQRFFSVAEFEDIAHTNAEHKVELFLRYWTLKEAAVKATGQGLSRALRRFCFTNPANKIFNFSDTQAASNHSNEFKFWSSTFEQRALSLCLKRYQNTSLADIKIHSRMLTWPLATENGQISELTIDWSDTGSDQS